MLNGLHFNIHQCGNSRHEKYLERRLFLNLWPHGIINYGVLLKQSQSKLEFLSTILKAARIRMDTVTFTMFKLTPLVCFPSRKKILLRSYPIAVNFKSFSVQRIKFVNFFFHFLLGSLKRRWHRRRYLESLRFCSTILRKLSWQTC